MTHCPRCGSQPVTEVFRDSAGVSEWHAICYLPTCRMRGPIRDTEEAAIAAWNERVPNVRQEPIMDAGGPFNGA